jgi:hypothetical protein
MEYEIKVINKLTKIDIINFPKILSIKWKKNLYEIL